MVSGEYFYINDCDTLGKFYVHHGRISDNPNNSCLRACFESHVDETKKIRFIPGYKTYDHKFFSCPLQAVYLQINSLESVEDEPLQLLAEFIVFSKDFTSQLKLKVIVYSQRSEDFMSINNYVNALNIYVAENNKIDSLNGNLFTKRLDFKPLNPNSILGIINTLDISFYSNDLRRVGKDNSFWNETEISNLPNSIYLQECIFETLKSLVIYDDVEKKGEIILCCNNYTKAWSPAEGRQKLQDDNVATSQIKDLLKLNILKFYNPTKEFNERLTKTASG